MTNISPILRFLLAGQLQKDYILLPQGKASLEIAGGSLLYAISGLAVWHETQAGLIGRVGEDYPQSWLEKIESEGFDCRGIRILPQTLDVRNFIAYTDINTRHLDNPLSHFARLGLQFPKSLLGYIEPSNNSDNRTQPTEYTIRPGDIPNDYLDATALHLCPIDYLSHHLLPAAIQKGQLTTITLDPCTNYMNPNFWDEVRILVKGLTAFMPSEEEIRLLYHGRSTDLWEMAEDIAAQQCETVIIKRGPNGQYLYNSFNRTRWIIPAYPAREVDPTGAGSVFCGGFMAGYRNTYDPLEAALHGNISASLSIEGSSPFYALDTLPGLAQARLNNLRSMIREA